MKNYNKDRHERYFLEVHFQYPEELHELHTVIYPFCLKEKKMKNLKNF